MSKEHIQKIQSLKYIKKQENSKAYQNKSSVPEKKTPPLPNNSGVNSRKKEEVPPKKE